MKILVTGSSNGIGLATVKKFLKEGHGVIGIDLLFSNTKNENYTHFIANVSKPESLPELSEIEILINNAGIQNEGVNDINVNLLGVINVTEKYCSPAIKSICNIASASAHSGAEFPYYAASKGGVLAYTKHTALEIAKFGATCNSLSPGGVLTELNAPVINDPHKWKLIMKETLLKKWATPEEIAEWVYFITVTNKSMTAQDILIDNGEIARSNFVW
ncbi:MAG: SDR family oxidoreductase [Clostridiales bacterium]|jgi:NAD(P)-dependent dehydrogenase (short-subunit alcohol dehydrogenase family)|nr:SDR family oxidoreductase [Clostridiales bacterium]